LAKSLRTAAWFDAVSVRPSSATITAIWAEFSACAAVCPLASRIDPRGACNRTLPPVEVTAPTSMFPATCSSPISPGALADRTPVPASGAPLGESCGLASTSSAELVEPIAPVVVVRLMLWPMIELVGVAPVIAPAAVNTTSPNTPERPSIATIWPIAAPFGRLR
jgi:hypothetical protein